MQEVQLYRNHTTYLMEYNLKFKKIYDQATYGIYYGYGEKLYYHKKSFIIRKGIAIESNENKMEIDRDVSKRWYELCPYMEITNKVLINLLIGNNVQKILALNIIKNNL